MGPDCRQTGLEVDNRNRNENRSHLTHKSMARIGIVEDALQHLENRFEIIKFAVENYKQQYEAPFPQDLQGASFDKKIPSNESTTRVTNN
ncbi:hypothetical protein Tco_0715367 [Tanacetum coccineum]